MAKRTFGRQAFLNPYGSYDSGYYKMSLKKSDEKPGRVSVFYRIADCSQMIELDFGTNGVKVHGVDLTKTDIPALVKSEIAFIKERRKKMAKFAKAVADFAAAYDVATAEAIADLEAEL